MGGGRDLQDHIGTRNRNHAFTLYSEVPESQQATNALQWGHQFKLFKCHSRLNCRSKYFFNRLINDWNALPAVVVNARVNLNSVNNFKSLLDNYLFDLRFTFVAIMVS